MASKNSTAAKAAPVAVASKEFVPTAPTHRVVAYRGTRAVPLGGGWVTESGNGIKLRLDAMPLHRPDGRIEEICVFLANREEGNSE